MIIKIKTFLSCLFLLTIVISCGNKKEQVKENPRELAVIKRKLDSLNINVEKISIDPKNDKIKIDVLLPSKISESELRLLSLDIYDITSYYENKYIFYDLEEDQSDYGWAYCHFRPNMEFKITGSTIEQDKELELNKPKSNGKVIGQWKVEGSLMGAIITFIDRNGKLISIIQFPGEKPLEQGLKTGTKSGKKTYFTNNDFGEYYSIEPNGNLGLYGNNGKFDEGYKIK